MKPPQRTESSTAFWFAAAAWAMAMSVAPDAVAISRFPGSIQSHYQPPLGYQPPCRLCHIQGTTGSGSVATPFGISMLARGLTSDRSTLAPALDALQKDNVDSDGDGIPDVAELLRNTDPNTPVNVPLSGEDPSYGCSLAIERPNAPAARSTLGAAAIGIAAIVRRRRRRPRAA